MCDVNVGKKKKKKERKKNTSNAEIQYDYPQSSLRHQLLERSISARKMSEQFIWLAF
jgi:hypothetical protein